MPCPVNGRLSGELAANRGLTLSGQRRPDLKTWEASRHRAVEKAGVVRVVERAHGPAAGSTRAPVAELERTVGRHAYSRDWQHVSRIPDVPGGAVHRTDVNRLAGEHR